MDKKKILKYIKLLITLVIIFCCVYFLFLRPYIEFKNNEKIMQKAAERYYYLNPDKLPTGNRVTTLTIKDLYKGAYIKGDIYLPYSKEPCSVNSWVKVRMVDNEYKYYTYLECGTLKSSTDHEGPKIVLNGDDEITIYKGDKYKELGVKSVSDATDGNMNIEDVAIDNSEVNTDKNGTYEVKYTASDMFNNKSVKIRKVKVIETLDHVTKKIVDKDGYVKGFSTDNNVLLSGIEFKIVSKDGNNIKLVTSRDIANVNYDGIDEWLEYFYSHLTNEAKEYIVKDRYCNDSIKEKDADKSTKCSNNTDKKNVYILSVQDMNNSLDKDGGSYLYPDTISWVANSISKAKAIATREMFSGTNSRYMAFDKQYNFGVRPVITVKADSLITSGDGTEENPYTFGERESGNQDEYLNTRYSGEYLEYSNYLFRIVDIEEDGTTKVIMNNVVVNKGIRYNTNDDIKIYNPKQKGNVGYKINKLVSEYIDGSYFVTKSITVPVYKTVALYGKEVKKNTYKVKFSAPNMYEMFSAAYEKKGSTYWLINSSNEELRKYIVSNNGVVYYEELPDSFESGIRIVGYLDKNVKILSGEGTKYEPYTIVK